jgi:hypothetical protein
VFRENPLRAGEVPRLDEPVGLDELRECMALAEESPRHRQDLVGPVARRRGRDLEEALAELELLVLGLRELGRREKASSARPRLLASIMAARTCASKLRG